MRKTTKISNINSLNIQFQGPTVWNSIDGNIKSDTIAIQIYHLA